PPIVLRDRALSTHVPPRVRRCTCQPEPSRRKAPDDIAEVMNAEIHPAEPNRQNERRRAKNDDAAARTSAWEEGDHQIGRHAVRNEGPHRVAAREAPALCGQYDGEWGSGPVDVALE